MHLPRLALLVIVPALVSAAAGEDDWPQWRGPSGTGVARGSAPTSWSDEENVKWVTALPGRAFSTPIIWGDRIFLTTAVPTGLEPAALADPPPDREADRTGGRRGRRGGRGGFGGFRGPTPSEHDFLGLCLDRRTGDVLWERILTSATPHESHHGTYGSFASNSPVTDGEHVYFSFGSRGLYCLDLRGKLLWKKDFGVKMRIAVQFGEGSTPVLAGDVLINTFDHTGDSFIVAVDKRSGEELWRVDRNEPTTWASPLPLDVDGQHQIIAPGTNRVRAYALDTGKQLWECAGLGTNPIPSPVRHGNTVLTMSGHRGPNIMAITLGGEGDLTDTDAVRWSSRKGASYTATPVLYEGRLYTVTDRGFISCFDAETGQPHYLEQRLPRGSQLKASPIVAGGKLYVATESGDVHVIEAGEELEVLATNTLEDQVFIASPVAVGGELFLRSGESLYCISESTD